MLLKEALTKVRKKNYDSYILVNISYDFVDAIKLGAPEGLISEFSRLEYKLSEPFHV